MKGPHSFLEPFVVVLTRFTSHNLSHKKHSKYTSYHNLASKANPSLMSTTTIEIPCSCVYIYEHVQENYVAHLHFFFGGKRGKTVMQAFFFKEKLQKSA